MAPKKPTMVKRSYTRKATAPSPFTTMKRVETRTTVEEVEIEFPVLMPVEGDTQGIRFSINSGKLECKLDATNENEEWDDPEVEVWMTNEWDTPEEFATFLTRLGKLVSDTIFLAEKK